MPEGCDTLNMRIGVHVGRVVAGVVGTKNLRYDMWGADVLTATLMESSGTKTATPNPMLPLSPPPLHTHTHTTHPRQASRVLCV